MKRFLERCLLGILLLILSGGGVAAEVVEGYDPFEKRRPMRLDNTGRLIGGAYILDACEATTGWTVLSNDTTSLATDLDHVMGATSLEFSKVDGAANLTVGGIQKVITAVNLTFLVENGGALGYSLNVSATTDLDYCFLRLGTDASNYNEWRVAASGLSAGWNSLRFNATAPATAGATGTGWDSAVVTFIALGCNFNLETDALADLRVDHVLVQVGLQVAADVNASVSSSSGASDVNLAKVGGVATDIGAANAGRGTQRVINATDDPNLAAINTDTTTIAADTSSLDTKITVEDLDTTGGTDNKQVVGIVVQDSGGAKLVGTAGAPLFVSVAGSTSAYDEEGPTATDGTPDEVLGSTDISQSDSWGIHIWNDGGGGNPLTDADVQVSRDGGASFFSLTWTECDGLVDTDDCDYDYPFNSFTHVKVYTTSAAGTTVTVQVSARPGVLGP